MHFTTGVYHGVTMMASSIAEQRDDSFFTVIFKLLPRQQWLADTALCIEILTKSARSGNIVCCFLRVLSLLSWYFNLSFSSFFSFYLPLKRGSVADEGTHGNAFSAKV